MVRGGSHRADTVVASGETTSYNSLEETSAVTSIVDTFEESELGRVKGLARVEASAQVLDCHVGMTNNVAPG